MSMTFKKNSNNTCKITWQETKPDGTIQEKFYMCKPQDAMWHIIQLRKSPSVIHNAKIER